MRTENQLWLLVYKSTNNKQANDTCFPFVSNASTPEELPPVNEVEFVLDATPDPDHGVAHKQLVYVGHIKDIPSFSQQVRKRFDRHLPVQRGGGRLVE